MVLQYKMLQYKMYCMCRQTYVTKNLVAWKKTKNRKFPFLDEIPTVGGGSTGPALSQYVTVCILFCFL